MSEEIKNGRIEAAPIYFEDHGILTCNIGIWVSGCQYQGFGGFDLRGTALAIWCEKILKTVGVDSWDKLKDTPVRIRCVDGIIIEIGNFMEDKWFNPQEELKEAAHA